MWGNDTGELQVVRFEHVDVKTVSKLNRILGAIKRLIPGKNARVALTINGGHVERWEVSKVLEVDEPHE